MKNPTPKDSRAGRGGETDTARLARRARADRITYSLDRLRAASETLTAEGFVVTAPPLPLVMNGIVLVATHPDRPDGFLIEAAELGRIARMGSVALDPYADGDRRARWQRDDQRDRPRKYAEAVLARLCTDVETAPDGARNAILSQAAWTLGRFVFDSVWGLNEAEAVAELERAAAACGLGEREIASVVQRGLKHGARSPIEPDDVLEPTPTPFDASKRFDAQKVASKETPSLSEKPDLMFSCKGKPCL